MPETAALQERVACLEALLGLGRSGRILQSLATPGSFVVLKLAPADAGDADRLLGAMRAELERGGCRAPVVAVLHGYDVQLGEGAAVAQLERERDLAVARGAELAALGQSLEAELATAQEYLVTAETARADAEAELDKVRLELTEAMHAVGEGWFAGGCSLAQAIEAKTATLERLGDAAPRPPATDAPLRPILDGSALIQHFEITPELEEQLLAERAEREEREAAAAAGIACDSCETGATAADPLLSCVDCMQDVCGDCRGECQGEGALCRLEGQTDEQVTAEAWARGVRRCECGFAASRPEELHRHLFVDGCPTPPAKVDAVPAEPETAER